MFSGRMYTTKAILHANYALGQQNSVEIQKWPGTVVTLLDKEVSRCTLKKHRQKCLNRTKISGEYRGIAQENGAEFWPWPLSGSGDPACADASALEVSNTPVTGTSDGSGVVIFNNKIPNGIYFMKETRIPTGYSNSNIYTVVVGDKALEKDDLSTEEERYLSEISTDVITGQTALYKTAFQDTNSDYDKYAIFLFDSTTNKAVATPDIAKNGVLNLPTATRKVILKKVAKNTYTPLADARFRIFRADLTEVINADYNQNNHCYTSFASGVYFVDQLPEGKYYLVETKEPGAEGLSSTPKVFILEVMSGMDTIKEAEESSLAAANPSSQTLEDRLKIWVADNATNN